MGTHASDRQAQCVATTHSQAQSQGHSLCLQVEAGHGLTGTGCPPVTLCEGTQLLQPVSDSRRKPAGQGAGAGQGQGQGRGQNQGQGQTPQEARTKGQVSALSSCCAAPAQGRHVCSVSGSRAQTSCCFVSGAAEQQRGQGAAGASCVLLCGLQQLLLLLLSPRPTLTCALHRCWTTRSCRWGRTPGWTCCVGGPGVSAADTRIHQEQQSVRQHPWDQHTHTQDKAQSVLETHGRQCGSKDL